MVTKPEPLPSLDDELVVPTAPRPDLKKLKVRSAVPDEAVQENSQRIGKQWGASTRVQADEPAAEPLAPVEALRVDLPDYLARALRVRAAEEKATHAYFIMKALSKDGFHVDPKDIVKNRYNRTKK